jgi:hypothetical protein
MPDASSSRSRVEQAEGDTGEFRSIVNSDAMAGPHRSENWLPEQDSNLQPSG